MDDFNFTFPAKFCHAPVAVVVAYSESRALVEGIDPVAELYAVNVDLYLVGLGIRQFVDVVITPQGAAITKVSGIDQPVLR